MWIPAGFLLTILACDEYGIKPNSMYLDSALNDSQEADEGFYITSISPNYGSLSGGTSVIISGNGFEGDVGVGFGNLGLEISIINDQTIQLYTPPSPTEGQIDVTVYSDLGSETIVGGFTYSNSAPQDTGTDTSTDTGNQTGTGLTGGFVEMWRKAYACPDCFDPPLPAQTIEASLNLHAPVNGSWISWLPPLNSCVSQINYPSLSNSEYLGDMVSIVGPQSSIGLVYDNSQGLYANAGVPVTSYSHQSIYGISAGNVILNQVLQTPNTFTDILPAGLLDPYGFSQPFSKNNFVVNWAPSGTSDYILFLLEVYGATYSTLLCLSSDIGGFGLDPTLMTGYSSGDPVVVSLYRLQITGALHPINNSTVEAIGAIGVVGTGYLIE